MAELPSMARVSFEPGTVAVFALPIPMEDFGALAKAVSRAYRAIGTIVIGQKITGMDGTQYWVAVAQPKAGA